MRNWWPQSYCAATHRGWTPASRCTGRVWSTEIALELVSLEQARVELGRTMPPIGVDAILAAWRAGTTAPPQVSTVVADVTGRPAHTFAQWAEEHANDFR